MCVSVITSRSNDPEDTLLTIVTGRQLITPKETGPGIGEISELNKSKTKIPLNLAETKFNENRSIL